MEFVIPALLVLMGVMLFMGTRKQKKQMADMQEMQASLTTGTRIQLMSGLFGTVIDSYDDFVDVEIAPGVVTRWNKLAVRGVVATDEAADTYVGAVVAADAADPDTIDDDAEAVAEQSDDPADEK
ncbi:preprotein translocase subunit YajC [Gordonia crocea]|uniref:Preprotein translocase subunit YajC n=1 Tax=Gordonia crocea TaxID=589162 RepID=A0A7I9UYJ0_9ACTN|nr:preprotein translocase subunit YajC [Gordonia crocea]GED97870.1 hypothetical protein nbrc107697_19090 [Gordonia crocea]